MDIPSPQPIADCLILLILLQEAFSDYILTYFTFPYPGSSKPLAAGTRMTDMLLVSHTQPT